jgi:hypothetical protein
VRAFTMYRHNVPKETHNELQANPPDQPQFEGVIWSDGTCTIRWMTARGSTAVWASFEDMLAIHGHPEYGSYLVWHDVIAGDRAMAADELYEFIERARQHGITVAPDDMRP